MPPKPGDNGNDVPGRRGTRRGTNGNKNRRIPMIERLESRALLSAAPFPSLVGSYAGTFQLTSGDSGTITFSVYNQVNGRFLGITTQSSGVNAVIKGTVTRTGVVHLTAKPNAFRQHGRGSGTFADGTFNLTEVIQGPGFKTKVTIVASKS
jgi:hypothetical protein